MILRVEQKQQLRWRGDVARDGEEGSTGEERF